MSLDEIDVQLEMKDRLNYPAILEMSLKNIKSTIRTSATSSKINTMILDFLYDIPSSWYDEKFAEDIKKVIKVRNVPNVVKWGAITLSTEYMKRNNIPLEKEIREPDYFTLKNAIINVLDRRNMLVRKDKIEASTGKSLKYETLDDLIDEFGEIEEDAEN